MIKRILSTIAAVLMLFTLVSLPQIIKEIKEKRAKAQEKVDVEN